LGWNNPN